MRQFDVYEAPTDALRRIAPYVVVVQSHYIDELPTVLIAPLLRPSERPVYRGVSLPIVLAQGAFLLSLAELATVNRTLLRRRVGDLRDHEDAIRRALDRVFTGF